MGVLREPVLGNGGVTSEDLFDLREIQGLGEVKLKAGFAGHPPVIFLGIAGHGDEVTGLGGGLVA